MDGLGYQILKGAILTLLFMFLVVLAKLINDWLTPYGVDEEIVIKDNVALSTSMCGYFTAVAIVFLGAMLGPSQGIVMDLFIVGGYSLFGIVLLNLSRFINDKLILHKFSNVKEIIKDRNPGTGAVQCGSYIASGLIVAGAIHGEGGGPETALAFFGLGQLALIIFTWIYNVFTPFDIHEEVEKDNVAAGVAFGGALVALGIILMEGASGNFVSWSHNLSRFGVNTLLIFVLIPVVRLFFDKVLIPKSDLNHEIRNDQNLGAAFLEATIMIGFSVVLLACLS